MSDHNKPPIVPDERAAIIALCCQLGHLTTKTLRRDLARSEVLELASVTAFAIATQEAFDGKHDDDQPIGADGIMPLIDARCEVLDRLRSLRKPRRRRR